jgi:hypothetical protein
MKTIALAISALALGICAASAEITITVPDRECPDYLCGTGRSVFIEGSIGALDYFKLKAAIDDGTIPPYSLINFNSTGGSESGGINLGRLIRESGLYTGIRAQPDDSTLGTDAECSDACALAFLGGTFRFADYGATYQPYPLEPATDFNWDTFDPDQENAAVPEYLQEMGLSVEEYRELSAGAPNVPVDPALLFISGVLSSEASQPIWSTTTFRLDDQSAHLYVEGRRETVYGFNRIGFFCSPHRGYMALKIEFDPQGRADEVLQMSAVSIELDGDYLAYDDYLVAKQETEDGYITALFIVPSELWDIFPLLDTLGFAFQYVRGDPIFLGYSDFPINESKAKLEELSASCD